MFFPSSLSELMVPISHQHGKVVLTEKLNFKSLPPQYLPSTLCYYWYVRKISSLDS